MRRLLTLTAPALLALAVTACGDDGGDDGITISSVPTLGGAELTRSGGCGEAYLWAADEDGAVAVTVGVDVRPLSPDAPTEVAIDLSDPEVDATLLRGEDLPRNFCTDLPDGDSEPTGRSPLVAGTGTLVVEPGTVDEVPCATGTGRLELTGVVAEDGTDVGSVTLTTDAIGCYSG